MGYHKTVFVGRLGSDPKISQVKETEVTEFSVAVNEKINKKDVTTWYEVSVWGKMAPVCMQYLKRGSQVLIEGKPGLNVYLAKDGTAKGNLTLNVREITFLDSKSSSQNNNNG